MPSIVFNKSVFAHYFDNNDPQALAWADNVLDKIIREGILPKYIIREDEGGETDLVDLYRPIAIFYAYLVRLAREFRDFRDSEFLIAQYLTNKNHYLSGTQSLVQLQGLVVDLLRRKAKRGGLQSIEKKDSLTTSSNSSNGEILELFGWEYYNFFKLGVPRPQYNSWNLNNSGPCYKGCTGRYDLNVGYEDSEDIHDLAKYPLINENFVFLTPYRGRNCIEIEQVPFGDFGGIGLHGDRSKEIVIDSRFNFEITFEIAQDITLENITFGCYAFDENGSVVALKNVVTGEDDNMFFETRRLNQAGRFYRVRGIIYNKDQPLLSSDEARLNIGFGHQLKFPENVVSIIPFIIMDNEFGDDSDSETDHFDSDSINTDPGESGSDDSGYWSDDPYDSEPSIYIWNLKVNPCSTEYERTFLNNKNFIDIFTVNNSKEFTDREIDDVLRKYFIPYNTPFKVSSAGSSIQDQQELYLLLEEGEDQKILQEQGEDDGFLVE